MKVDMKACICSLHQKFVIRFDSPQMCLLTIVPSCKFELKASTAFSIQAGKKDQTGRVS